MEKLYIIMRSDMVSHTPGKKMAQASHAANAFVKLAKQKGVDIAPWENSTPQGFGTVYVLDGGAISDMREAIDPLIEQGFVAGFVNDPTYPVIDGNVFHSINIDTCAFVYCEPRYEKIIKKYLDNFPLHP